MATSVRYMGDLKAESGDSLANSLICYTLNKLRK